MIYEEHELLQINMRYVKLIFKPGTRQLQASVHLVS